MNRSKVFILWFLAISACLLVCVATLNILVDPYDLLGIRLLPALVRSDRSVKTDLLAQTPIAPDVIVMGSSRTLKLSPETIQRLTGQTALNLGTGSCRAEGPLLMCLYAESIDRLPETIILGVDIEAFHDKLPVDRRWNRVPEVRNRIEELHVAGYKVFFNNLAEVVSLAMARDSVRSIQRQFDSSPPPPRTQFREDGVIEYPLWQSQKDNGTFDLNAQIEHSIEEYRGRFKGYEQVSPWRKQRFEQFLQFCRDNDIRLIAFITTLHPRVRDDLRERADFDRLKTDLVTFLETMQDTYTFELYDLTDPTTYGGDAEHFWDGSHIDSVNADKLLKYLLAPERRNPQGR